MVRRRDIGEFVDYRWPALMTREIAAEYCSMRLRGLDEMVRCGNMPLPINHGTKIPKWRRSDLDLWISLGCPKRIKFEAERKALMAA